MMVLKSKLEISYSSTTFIKEVFANLQRVRSNSITKSRYQSSIAEPETALVRPVVADWPQAAATSWQPYIGIGLAGLAWWRA